MNTAKFQGELEALGERLQQTLLRLSPLLQLQIRCGIRQETLLILVEHLLHIEPDPEQTLGEIKRSLTEIAPDLFRSGLVHHATGQGNSLPVRVYLRIVGYQEPYQSQAFTLESLAPATKPAVKPAAPARLAALPPPVPVILPPSPPLPSTRADEGRVDEVVLPSIADRIVQQPETQPPAQLNEEPEASAISEAAQLPETAQADEEILDLSLAEPLETEVAEEIAVAREIEIAKEIAIAEEIEIAKEIAATEEIAIAEEIEIIEERIAEAEAHLVADLPIVMPTATPIVSEPMATAIDIDEISHPEISSSELTISELAEAESTQAGSTQAEEVEPLPLPEQPETEAIVEAEALIESEESVEAEEPIAEESIAKEPVESEEPPADWATTEYQPHFEPIAVVAEVTEVAEAEIHEPIALQKASIEPEIAELEIAEPEAITPEAITPEIAEAAIAEPETITPEIAESEVITPEAITPAIAEPETITPEIAEAAIVELETITPAIVEPEATEPEIAEPQATLSEPAIAAESSTPVPLTDGLPTAPLPIPPAASQPINPPDQHPNKPFGTRFSLSTLMLGGSVGLFLLVSGAYFLTRPCVVGAVCEPLQKAQQLDQNATQTIATTDSALAVVEAHDQLIEASYLLGSIPSWSGHHQTAQTLQATYESKSKTVGQVVKALKQANAAALKSQNPPHPLPKWRQIQWDWREAIATLEKVPPDSPVLMLSQKKLAEYKVNLANTDRRVLAEQNAQDKVATARKTAAVAENRAAIAITSESWQQVYLTWQAAIDLLQQVPQGTMAHAEAQQFINLYQSAMAKADNQRNQEQVSTGSYQEAVNLAEQARNWEQQSQWTQAVGLWRKAVINVQQIPQGTAYYNQAQPLISEYQAALTQAEANLNRSSAMQSVKPDLDRACLGTVSAASKCTYTLSSDGIRIQITPQYDRAVENAITRAQTQGSASARTAVTAQVNELLQNLAEIGKTAQVPIELYSSDGSIFASFAPDQSGYVAE
ncbi:MAG: hypothetical protein KME15_01610 [Drouetiella hepatica Uher 2000/2452]|uniref:Uncharacterized protein n=1 Tax=Drouetiella hepatica Uher 2000/2452 TaxID=904376 RepID=A0A951Q6Q2_9CYAN|nr:hypothetical protein [Drouetiella hepatica Uher 2000/2452]